MDEFKQCPICFLNYDLVDRNRQPKLLPCQQHSVCAKCAFDIMKGTNVIECPMDRVRHTIRYEDIPNNRFIMQYLESHRGGGGSGSMSPPAAATAAGGPPPYPVNNGGFGGMPQIPVPGGASGFGGNHQQPPMPIIPIPNMPPQNQPLPPMQPNYNQHPQQTNGGGASWDLRNYLRKMFDEIDHNHDGEISVDELHEALRRGQSNAQFDPSTVRLLVQKYDKNNDFEISFQEFYDLFVSLNDQYNDFLDIDKDFSGSIDGSELSQSLRQKGFNFNRDLYEYIIYEISRRAGTRGITFDMYVRVIARFDYLRATFNRSNPNYSGNGPNQSQLESYIRQSFFQNF